MQQTIYIRLSAICFLAMTTLPVHHALAAAKTTAVNTAQSSAQLQQQIDTMKHDYDRRLRRMEKRLKQTQAATRTIKPNAFNPAISLVLTGLYASYSNNPDNYTLPAFALGNEAGLDTEGFSLGESEITMGSNVDQNFYGQATFSFGNEKGNTTISVEEAFFETIGLPHGLHVKAGRFFSAMGYINGKHSHAWDFNDAPLVYRGMFGDQLKEEGVQASWILPTDHYILLGGELGNGVQYPSADSQTGVGDWVAYLKTGGDINLSNSWELGVSHWQAGDINKRQTFNPVGADSIFSGNSKIDGLDFVYKWAPNGNPLQHNFKFQWEYFNRLEDGQLTLNTTSLVSSYAGHQSGWYAQGVYQFIPNWTTGLRYDRLDSNNSGNNQSVLDQAGLSNTHTPQRTSVMLSWQASHFSRIRAQYNYDESTANSDNQLLIQYTMVMGAHGAHAY